MFDPLRPHFVVHFAPAPPGIRLIQDRIGSPRRVIEVMIHLTGNCLALSLSLSRFFWFFLMSCVYLLLLSLSHTLNTLSLSHTHPPTYTSGLSRPPSPLDSEPLSPCAPAACPWTQPASVISKCGMAAKPNPRPCPGVPTKHLHPTPCRGVSSPSSASLSLLSQKRRQSCRGRRGSLVLPRRVAPSLQSSFAASSLFPEGSTGSTLFPRLEPKCTFFRSIFLSLSRTEAPAQ